MRIEVQANASNASADSLQLGNNNNNHGLTILSATNAQGRIDFTDTVNTADPQGKVAYYHDSDSLQFFTNGASSSDERLRIDSSGRLLVGRTSANLNSQVQIGGRYVDCSSTTVDLDTSGTEGPNIKIHTSSNTADHCAAIVFDHGSLKSMIAGGRVNTSNWGTDIRFYTHPESTSNVHETYERMKINSSGHLVPAATNTYDLGASGLRWRNVYTTDLQLSNEGKTNDVDGTWGNYTIQEGESDLFLINNRNGKKYKFNLTEVS